MKTTKTIAFISLCSLVLFVIIIVSFHFLRPDKNMLSCFLSEYAVGDYGWLMTIAFYALAFAAAMLFRGLLLNTKSSKTSNITLSIFCMGILLAGIFPTDIPGVPPPTPHGLIHAIAGLFAFISLGISILAWGFVFKKNENWKSFAKPSIFFGAISLVLFIVHFVSPISLKGLTQRILMVWDISWLFLVSRKLYHDAAGVAISTNATQ
jgi:uncharacterized membrane protein